MLIIQTPQQRAGHVTKTCIKATARNNAQLLKLIQIAKFHKMHQIRLTQKIKKIKIINIETDHNEK
jgi:hypothetical protein